jgi:hypothetical protein
MIMQVNGPRGGPVADPTQPRPAPEAGAGSGETTRTFPGGEGATRPRIGRPAKPLAGPSVDANQPRPPAGIVRSGPGVPVPEPRDKAGGRAEQIWRDGPLPGQPRRPKLRRLLGAALTVVLLAASGVVLYLRIHHTPPVQVTSVTIAQRTGIACGVDVTGRITTNGAAGMVSYQWLVQPGRRQPRPKTVSIISGQHVAQVTLLLPLTGHGRASELVTLQVLAPDPKAASANVAVSC